MAMMRQPGKSTPPRGRTKRLKNAFGNEATCETSVGRASPFAEIIYEDDELRVIRQAGDGELLLITFSDLVTLADGLRFFGAVPAAKAGLPAIGFVAKRPSWYPAVFVDTAIQAIAAHLAPYRTRIVYGGSMGGYAALKFSRALMATQVVSLCPQWSIDPDECGGVESGWSSYYQPELQGMGIRGEDVIGQAFVFADLSEPVERFHCSRIQAEAPQTLIVDVPAIGHHVTAAFAGTDNLRELIQATLDGDVAKARSFAHRARRARRARPFRLEVLVARGYSRHRRLCLSHMLASARERPQVLNADPRFLYDALKQTVETAGRDAMLGLFSRVQATLQDPERQLRTAVLAALLLDTKVVAMTHHGTRLVYDFALDTCRHAARSDPNTEVPIDLELDGALAILSVQAAGTRLLLRPDRRGQLGCTTDVDRSKAPSAFKVEPAPDGCFRLSWGGVYLSAEPGGRLICDRTIAGTWEQVHFTVA